MRKTDRLGQAESRLLYRHLTLFLRKRYLLFWFLAGGVSFALTEATFSLLGETHVLWTQLFFSFLILAALPAGYIFLAMNFPKLEEILSPISSLQDEDLVGWLYKESRCLFNDKSPLAWGPALLVTALGTLTLLRAGLQFESSLTNLLVVIGMQAAFLMCGHSAGVFVRILLFEYRIARLPLSVPLFGSCYQQISVLTRYIYCMSLAGLIEYVGLFFAVRLTPFVNPHPTLPWLAILAVTPILMLIFGVFQIHTLQRRIKLHHLENLNTLARDILKVKPPNYIDNLDKTIRLVELRQHFEADREWPLSLQTIVTLILSTAAVVSQVLLSFDFLG